MPIYEFVCEQCGHEFESFQRLSDPLPDQCPSCQGGPVTKKISAAGFRLKGGGWYETDFKSGSKKNLSGAAEGGKDGGKEAGSSDSSKGGDSSGTGGDSKSAGSSGDSSGSSKAESGSSGQKGSGASAKKD